MPNGTYEGIKKFSDTLPLRRLLFNSDNLDQPGVEVDSLLSETSNSEALRCCDQAEQLALGHAHLVEHTDGHKGIKKFQLHAHKQL